MGFTRVRPWPEYRPCDAAPAALRWRRLFKADQEVADYLHYQASQGAGDPLLRRERFVGATWMKPDMSARGATLLRVVGDHGVAAQITQLRS